jgi:hypothetical protein
MVVTTASSRGVLMYEDKVTNVKGDVTSFPLQLTGVNYDKRPSRDLFLYGNAIIYRYITST